MRITKSNYEWLIVLQIGEYQYWINQFVAPSSKECLEWALLMPHIVSVIPANHGEWPDNLSVSIRVMKHTDPQYKDLLADLQFDDRAVNVEIGENTVLDNNWLDT
ncbi:hypothetical protein [Cohnella soli]|uniref:Uncharacterized protein n=1 Tax=Cohnella soli TaxID=425005 RepID=A0ABW0HMP9_9BACL